MSLMRNSEMGWSLMIFCARATRGLRRMERIAWPSSCSRNAHNQNVLVRHAQSRIDQATLKVKWGRRAQWKINQPPSLKRQRASLEGLFRGGVDEVRQVGILLSYTDKEMDEETAGG